MDVFDFDCPTLFYRLPLEGEPLRTAEEQERIDREWFTVSHEAPVDTVRRLSSGCRRLSTRSSGQERAEEDDLMSWYDKKHGMGSCSSGSMSIASKENVRNRQSTLSSRSSSIGTASRRSSVAKSLSSTSSSASKHVVTRSVPTAPTAAPTAATAAVNKKRPLSSVPGSSVKSTSSTFSQPSAKSARTASTALAGKKVATTLSSSLSQSRLSLGSTSDQDSVTSRQSVSRSKPLLAPNSRIPIRKSVVASHSAKAQNDDAKDTSSGVSLHKPSIRPLSSSSSSTTSRILKPVNKLLSSSASVTSLSSRGTDKSVKKSEDASLEQLLKKHNARFAPAATYEPPRHSVRDVRRWEKKSGKTWSTLKPDERERANDEISKLKAGGLL